MATDPIFKKIWSDVKFEFDVRQTLQKALYYRAKSGAEGLIKAIIRAEFQRSIGAVTLVDEDFDTLDKSPEVIPIARGLQFGLASRGALLNGNRILLILEVPKELESGAQDFELDLKIGEAQIVEDNYRSSGVNSNVLNNRLRFVTDPPALRLTSATTIEQLLKEVRARLKAVAKADGATVAA